MGTFCLWCIDFHMRISFDYMNQGGGRGQFDLQTNNLLSFSSKCIKIGGRSKRSPGRGSYLFTIMYIFLDKGKPSFFDEPEFSD
jgi:hypothetical protein